MDFEFDPSDEAFREEVRSFVRANLPEDIRDRVRSGFHVSGYDISRWGKILNSRGWAAPSWPVEHGGPGWDMMRQFIFDEVTSEEGAPPIDAGGAKMFGPIINTFGTPEQIERFNKPWLDGDLRWGQGFSEPNAGSDLAALSTTAVRDGESYIINGRKIWTTNCQYANWIFCLVKTKPEAKQRGISMIVVPVDAVGVTIRPIIDIGGGHSLNEVFLDEVRTPAENLIGEENMGWTYAKRLLENERAFSAEVPRNRLYLRELRRLARMRKRSGRPLIEDAAFSARVEQLQSDLDSLQWMTLRALTEKAGGDTSLPLGSILKIRGSELLQKITEMHIECLGDQGSYFREPNDLSGKVPGNDHPPGILADFLYRRATTIYGGANEIQRTIIAKQFLGL